MKKNVLSGITAAAFFLSCYGTALAGTPSVVVNQQTLQLDQPPVIVQSRTLVPMRAIFEALGCEVTWDQDSQTVFAQKELNSISIEIGDTTMYTSSKNRILDVPAQIINGRTMVPLRAVSEALNADVSWNTDTETVTVTTKGQGDYKYTSGSYKKTQGIASVDTIYPQFIVPSDKNDTILTGINQELAAAATSRAIDFFHQCSDFNDSELNFICFLLQSALLLPMIWKTEKYWL